MRGRKGIANVLTKQEFIDLYTSGKSFDDIGEMYGSKGQSVKEFFLENFLGFERFKLKTEHMKKLHGGDID